MRASKIFITMVSIAFCVLLFSATGSAQQATRSAQLSSPSADARLATAIVMPMSGVNDEALRLDDNDDDEEVYVALDADGNGKADNKDGDNRPDQWVRVLVKFAKRCGIPLVMCAVEGVPGPLQYICAFRAGWNCAKAYDDR